MHPEIPVFKRCCFCFPLRYGLLLWGYFKLIIASFLMLFFLFRLYELLIMYAYSHGGYSFTVGFSIIICVILAVLAVDVTLHAVFVAGAHKKDVKMLRIYYIYSVVLVTLTIVLGLFAVYLSVASLSNHFNEWKLEVVLMDMSALFVNIVIQIYIIFLVKSEIVKLQNFGQCSFVNNAAEAECTLKIGHPYEDNIEGQTAYYPENGYVIGTCQNKGNCARNGEIGNGHCCSEQ